MFHKASYIEKIFGYEGGGTKVNEYHNFLSKFVCLTVPKNFAEEPFCVSESFWYRKLLGIKEGAGITIFRQNCFCLTVPNHSLEEAFCVSERFGYRKMLGIREGTGIKNFR